MASSKNAASVTNSMPIDPRLRRLQVVFARKMEERKLYMEELKERRHYEDRRIYRLIKKSVGPIWYQVLSTNQRRALDDLNMSIYQDILEGRPARTMRVINALGIHPLPNKSDLFNCMYLGRDDPKQVLANIFHFMTQHTYNEKLLKYNLNERLLLSGIYYLALDSLIELLKDKFKPNPPPPPPPKKPKPKPAPRLKSPYLQDMVAKVYEPKKPKKRPVFALPNLEDLNEPYDETPPVPPTPPPPPPPPPPKKRLPIPYCDKLGEYKSLFPQKYTEIPEKTQTKSPTIKSSQKKILASKVCFPSEKKKAYGISVKPKKKRRKLRVPKTGFDCSQYQIQGVYTYNGKSYFIIGAVCVMPNNGFMIHGGHRLLGREYIQINKGISYGTAPYKSKNCDCLMKYHNIVFEYIKRSKCYCKHYYDFGHEEGTWPQDEIPYFEKPNKRSGFQFNYANIYETDPKVAVVKKEFQKVWDTDSLLHEEHPEDVDPEKKKKKKKVKKSSKTCLGKTPKIRDYLRCALRWLRRVNMAARLPDLHNAPELVEWMRYRIYGPYTKAQKIAMQTKSLAYYTYLKTFQKMGLGKASPPNSAEFQVMSTWKYKTRLLNQFSRFIKEYKYNIFKSHCFFNNLLWATMFQAQLPDKKFREIYFSYLVSRVSDIHLIHPYSQIESWDRWTKMLMRRMTCIPKYILHTI